MKKWQEELLKHPINTSIQKLEEALEIEVRNDDPALELERSRFAKIVFFLQDGLKKLDADLTPIDLLTQINNQLQSHGAFNTLSNLASSKDPNLFRDLNVQINPSLSYIVQLHQVPANQSASSSDTKAATAVYEKFLSSITSREEKFADNLRKIEERLQNALQQFESLANDTSSIREDFSKFVEAKKVQLDELVRSIEEQTQNDRLSNKKEFSDLTIVIKEKYQEEIENLIEKYDEQLLLSQKATQTKLDGIISDSDSKHEEIKKLYGLVALVSVTGGHKEIADREHDAAQNWRYVTIVSILVAAGWIGYNLFWMDPIIEPDRLFWLQLGKSFSLTVLLLSLAVYASKQSSLHRIRERKTRAFFLQVQAFDPFVQSLPEPKRVELKEALSSRIFGKDEDELDRLTMENGDFKSLDRLFSYIEQAKKLFVK